MATNVTYDFKCRNSQELSSSLEKLNCIQRNILLSAAGPVSTSTFKYKEGKTFHEIHVITVMKKVDHGIAASVTIHIQMEVNNDDDQSVKKNGVVGKSKVQSRKGEGN